jgi:hypothetical protein
MKKAHQLKRPYSTRSKGEIELTRTWRHIEDAMKLMRGPHQS